ncbi:hypothetical protein ACQKMV_10620 [Lysinibacillus sp. NPDC094403]
MVEIEGKGNEEFREFVIPIEEEGPINLGIGGIGATEDLMKRITGN